MEFGCPGYTAIAFMRVESRQGRGSYTRNGRGRPGDGFHMTALALAAGALGAAAVALPVLGAAWTRRAPLAGVLALAGLALGVGAVVTERPDLLLGAWLATAVAVALLAIGVLVWRALEDG
jgi:hypothetical protein